MKPVKPHYFDVTSVTDMDELTACYGLIGAWTISVTQLRRRAAEATDRKRKQYLGLMLLNAETQLALHNQGVEVWRELYAKSVAACLAASDLD